MANLRIKVGTIEMTAQGGAEFIAQERGAFNDFLKHKIGEDLLAAQKRRAAIQEKKTTDKPEAAEPVKPAAADVMCAMRRLRGSCVSPAELKRYKAEGKLNEHLYSFDEIDITLDNGRTMTIVCGYSDCKKARFVFKDCYDEHVMNEEDTNKTGYKGSAGRKHVLEDIYPHMPQEWKDIIVPRVLTEIIDGHKIDYADPMWLPSATDVFGASEDGYWPIETDSFQLDIFKRERDRVKECGDNGTYLWWLRSVSSSSTHYFRRVNTRGGSSSNPAYYSFGFAPGFDI